jgi:hypothetical protein
MMPGTAKHVEPHFCCACPYGRHDVKNLTDVELPYPTASRFEFHRQVLLPVHVYRLTICGQWKNLESGVDLITK